MKRRIIALFVTFMLLLQVLATPVFAIGEIIEENLEENSQVEVTEEKQEDELTEKVETEIASFSTKIYTKDANRQNNVRITCSSLNDTLVENGATFSFCNTVGQATTAKGYKKAEIFDAKRK